MQVIKEQIDPTKIKITVAADKEYLELTKKQVIAGLSRNAKVPGFRPGKAPPHLTEKQLDQAVVQSEFIDFSINELYVKAIEQEKLRPVAQPRISVTKFVPFSTLEFTAEFDAVGDIILPSYKNIKINRKKVAVTAKEINEVLDNLLRRAAKKKEVQRPAAANDEVMLDFTGTDSQTKAELEGISGKDYPLQLGSQSFIPGFEENIIGLKTGQSKNFNLKFPSDYQVKNLQNRSVDFSVTVGKVLELVVPKLNDAFAASIGPFKSVSELKADIKKQLSAERQREADQIYDNELLQKIAEKTTVAIPDELINEEIERLEEDEKRNVIYRGQTWQEHLVEEGLSAEEHKAKQRPAAEQRVKSGLILGVIADREHIHNTGQELETRITLLKNQYINDPQTLAELDKPEGRREISNRLLIEKTLLTLRGYTAN